MVVRPRFAAGAPPRPTPAARSTPTRLPAAVSDRQRCPTRPEPSRSDLPVAFATGDGEPFNGANNYVLRFPNYALPPVNAFSSVTLYDADGYAIENPIHRTQIGTYDDLATGSDGTVTIYIQHDTPGPDNESNWLPSPEGPFNLTMSLYNPHPAALTLDWTPPAVERRT